MPEGPEVRRTAVRLDAALAGQPIVQMTARTKAARAWLEHHSSELVGKMILKVRSHGKHLIGWIEGDYYFHSHFMMWGRWETIATPEAPAPQPRERARIVTKKMTAILTSAPVFEVGAGDPYEELENVSSLGPDAIPYPQDGPFNVREFNRRLKLPANRKRAIGVALLDQRIVAGLGNYLRAEILFECRLDPWKTIGRLTRNELKCLDEAVGNISHRAWSTGGITVTDTLRKRMLGDPSLTYRPGSDYGSRHYVFRRTNLPCLHCGTPIRQLRQITSRHDEGDRSRITYFCPECQNVEAGGLAKAKRLNSRRTKSPSA